MKKISILLTLAFLSFISYAQELDDIRDMLNSKDYVKAKAAIDKYLADGKNANKAEAWYLKGKTYNWYSNEKTTPAADLYNLKTTAFEALKKNQLLDPKDVFMKLENWGTYLDLYFSLYDLGANLFNEKKYEDAFASFKKALEVEDYILGKKYVYSQATLNALDTSLILNTAIAASQAKKDDESVIYFRKLTDANVSGESNKEVYEFLVDYYNKKNDAANLAAILEKSKRIYPGEFYWSQVELDNISKQGDKAALFAKYEEMLGKDPSNFALAYNYSVELYNKLYNGEPSKQPDIATQDKLSSVLKSAIANDQGIDATVLMANHTYNMASDAVNAASMVKGTKPDDIKKKNELKAISVKKMDDCILYSEQAAKFFENKTDLKAKQQANYKIILGYLSDIYNLKGDAKKSAEYEKRRTSIK